MARWLPSLFVRPPHTGSLSAAATPSSSTESSTAPTQDADVFSDKQGGVEAAADAVEAALLDAGFGTERRDKTGGWIGLAVAVFAFYLSLAEVCEASYGREVLPVGHLAKK
jgi:hypothetical protein